MHSAAGGAAQLEKCKFFSDQTQSVDVDCSGQNEQFVPPSTHHLAIVKRIQCCYEKHFWQLFMRASARWRRWSVRNNKFIPDLFSASLYSISYIYGSNEQIPLLTYHNPLLDASIVSDWHIKTIITFQSAVEYRQIDPFSNYYRSLGVCVQTQCFMFSTFKSQNWKLCFLSDFLL